MTVFKQNKGQNEEKVASALYALGLLEASNIKIILPHAKKFLEEEVIPLIKSKDTSILILFRALKTIDSYSLILDKEI